MIEKARLAMRQIDHVFVLMLENRSFDHFFGLSGRPGIPRPADPDFRPGATDRSVVDPPHEFEDVRAQVHGGAMSGFSQTAKQAFSPHDIPVITQLAQEFLLFDNWYSSLPGPTWPNRFFVHAASSGGLAASPSALDDLTAVTLPSAAFKFQHGTIFDRLSSAGKKWRIYHGDVHPQVLSVEGMVAKSFNPEFFRPLYPEGNASGFAADLQGDGYDVAYTFIEPNYAIQLFSQFVQGDSQHPRGLVSAGEGLVKFVYETIRNSSVWQNSLLLITWDEHGGFFDHVPPPPAIPPGDTATNRARAGPNSPEFGFDVLGVRVPAILVSPWVSRGVLGSKVFPGSTFDHTSVISSLRANFGLGEPITHRDAAAPNWWSALNAQPRTGLDAGPHALAAVQSVTTPAPAALGMVREPVAHGGQQKPDPFIEGVALIALDLDRFVSQQKATPTLATQVFQKPPLANSVPPTAQVAGADLNLKLLSYIQQVDAKVLTHKESLKGKP
ncbi:alkaline phosphatase family protein [Sphaerotilus sp.]|uniref:alkaline phosphatase family protein n=1 Tax=Sphaerotilus sp. TaxID=2093942 RepID=UPI0034E234FE